MGTSTSEVANILPSCPRIRAVKTPHIQSDGISFCDKRSTVL